LVFFTSAAVLVLEILAGRLMAPYIGVSLETFTGIIGTVLAGIALGNSVGGKLADRGSAERLIGPMLMVGGLLSWAALPIVALTGPAFGDSPVAIVALTLLAFFAPAAVLSAISPMAAKLRLTDLGATGEVVGGLSAAGTVGALAGTFITGFVLVSAIATKPIVIGVGAALVLSGLVFTIRNGGKRPDAAVIALAFVTLGGAITATSPCDFESAYFCGSVVTNEADPSLRVLLLDGVRHAAVDLDDPTHLEFRYIRLLASVVDAAAEGPLDVLHIGGGGFTLPRYVDAVRPGSTNTVLEIDPLLIDIGRDELGLVATPGLDIRTGDARLALDDLGRTFDIVIGDAFAGTSVPWHLTTAEFVSDIKASMTPEGIYAMNVIDGRNSDFARAEVATLMDAFAYVAVVIPSDGVPNRPVNQILLASNVPLPEFVIDPADGVLVDDVTAYVDGARKLTDDFAPVDSLSLN
jgi:MFS family permease